MAGQANLPEPRIRPGYGDAGITNAESEFAGTPKIPRWYWVVVTVVALAIRLYRLDHFSYRLDEILECFTIHDSWRGIFGSLRWQGIQAPLDYGIGKLIDGFDPSDAARKLPAVLWGTASVVVAGRFVTRRAGAVAGLIAGALLAVAPFHVHYSQELRPYSLGVFLLFLSLLALDRHLAAPSHLRLAALYFACLATAYTLYLSTLALLIAGSALVIEDCFSTDPRRARSARRFLARGPLFGVALWLGFLPWWPIFLTGIRSAPMGVAPPFSIARIGRFFSFFGFGHADWEPLGVPGLLFVAGCLAGATLAWRTPRTRFLVVWPLIGLPTMELLEQRHPVFDSIFHYIPMGVSLVILFSLPMAALISRRATRTIGATLLIISIGFELGSLRDYFGNGRPDWRPLGAYLRAAPVDERILTESDYAMLCVAYYVSGPGWLHPPPSHGGEVVRSIVSLQGQTAPIAWLWKPGKTLWLVLAAEPRSPALRGWAEPYPGVAFPTAEGGAVVKRLDRRREP